MMFKSEQDFEAAFGTEEFIRQYAEYIMRNCAGDRIIANGDMLLVAMEDMYLYEEFKESML